MSAFPSPMISTRADGGITLIFPAGATEFASSLAAEAYLKDRGFSVGQRQGLDPRGILFGDVDIQKWRNLRRADIAALHGEMTDSNRAGPTTVRIYATAPEAATAAVITTPRGPLAKAAAVIGGEIATIVVASMIGTLIVYGLHANDPVAKIEARAETSGLPLSPVLVLKREAR